MKISTAPTLDLEFEILQNNIEYVAGVDEVGRGALAGPVTVGVAVVNREVGEIPTKLRDSKLIAKSVRENLIAPVSSWVSDSAIGHAQPDEIDELGIVAALRLAWQRAYEQLKIKPQHVILDGKHNWIAANSDLFPDSLVPDLPVTMKIKADQHCASVAAASVLAKVERDNLMVAADSKFAGYGFAGNVGYGSAGHMQAIRELGATDFHRRSWNLPT